MPMILLNVNKTPKDLDMILVCCSLRLILTAAIHDTSSC